MPLQNKSLCGLFLFYPQHVPHRIVQADPALTVGFGLQKPVAGKGNRQAVVEISPGHTAAVPHVTEGLQRAARAEG